MFADEKGFLFVALLIFIVGLLLLSEFAFNRSLLAFAIFAVIMGIITSIYGFMFLIGELVTLAIFFWIAGKQFQDEFYRVERPFKNAGARYDTERMRRE